MPAGGLHCAKHVELCISHRFFRCFPACVAFRIGFYSIFADSRLSAHAGLDLHLSFSSVWGVGGDDVHANAACVFRFFCCVTSQTLPVCRFLLLHC